MKRSHAIALLAFAGAVAAFLKRPVKRPDSPGRWEPAGKHRSPHRPG